MQVSRFANYAKMEILSSQQRDLLGMRKVKKNGSGTRKLDEVSLSNMSMEFLIDEAVDRSAFEAALKSIEPLSDLEEVISKNEPMPETTAAIRRAIDRVNKAISSKPDTILSALGLSDPQKELLNAITSAEVLKFSILNAMDAVRMYFINDFKKNLKFYDDEIVSFNVIDAGGGRASISRPQRAPLSVLKDLGSYEIHEQGRSFMIIGPESSATGLRGYIDVPGRGRLPVKGVVAGKIYLAGRNSDGEPEGVKVGLKQLFLKISPPPGGKGELLMKIEDLATRPGKSFDLKKTVKENLRIPEPVEGTVISIYRAIRGRPAIEPADLDADNFSDDLKNITLESFRKYFEAFAEKTSTSTGDLASYDLADTLVYSGLATVSGFLGLTRPPTPRGGEGDAATGGGSDGGGGGRGGGAGGGGGRGGRQHSLRNFLNTTKIVKGANPAEKASNLSTVMNLIDQDEMRSELNRFVGPGVVFTEGTVDRWCELAGIKENR